MKLLLAVCAVLLAGAGTAFAQQTCLHDRSETQADRTRRERAITVARAINTAEHMGLSPRQPGQRYRPFEQLTMVPAIPAGFELQFHTDGDTYTFSLKDTRDPCKYAIFSDQEGLIYEAAPMRPEARVVPLGTT
ncbi:MAG: hypothetical protein FJW14_04795 [Acidimicrobiia bacterium]|nr:hypothetical protein [Acidimicrobiia bacterium]